MFVRHEFYFLFYFIFYRTVMWLLSCVSHVVCWICQTIFYMKDCMTKQANIFIRVYSDNKGVRKVY